MAAEKTEGDKDESKVKEREKKEENNEEAKDSEEKKPELPTEAPSGESDY